MVRCLRVLGLFVTGVLSLPVIASVPYRMSMERPGAVRPAGWIGDWARAAAAGYTGHMDLYDAEFRVAWTAGHRPRGVELNWTSAPKGSWSAEGGAYWFDGLVRLAWQLDDPSLKALARERLAPLLDNMRPNGVLFNWWLDRDSDEERRWAYVSPAPWQLWAAGISERPVAAWLAATGDTRARRALEYAFDDPRLITEASVRKAPIAGAVLEAARVTGSGRLVASAAAAAADPMPRFQVPPKPGLEATLNLRRPEMDHMKSRPMRHGVSTAEGLLSVVRAYAHTGRTEYLAAVRAWFAFLDRHAMQPYGVTVSDEEWGWTGANRGSETCTVAAEPWTRTELMMLLGEGAWGDQVERAFFNAAPACVSRDFSRHVYLQIANRTKSDDFSEVSACQAFRDMKEVPTRFSEKHYPLCCTAALNRLIPDYVQAMWMTTADGGIAAALYGPSSFAAELAAGKVEIRENTSYPFEETVDLAFETAPDAAMPLALRLPGWCADPSVTVNGESAEGSTENGFMTIRRVWKKGDVVRLRFPMRPVMAEICDRNHGGELRRTVSLGPLLMAQAYAELDENEPAGEVREPVLGSDALKGAKVIRHPMPPVWDWPVAAPVRVRVRTAVGESLELIPYGCAKLRTSMFACREE